MAALPAGLAWVAAGLGISQYGSDFLPQRKNNRNDQQQYAQPPVYQIHATHPQGFGLSSIVTAAFVGGGVVVFFGAYKYFWGANPLDKVLPQLEQSSKETLEQVRKADENARIRAQQMDENNRRRLLELQCEMQGEQRGNFDVLSEQINALTQIALQTLTTITPSEQLAVTAGGPYDNQQVAEIRNQRNNINGFAARAQQVADEIADPNYHEQKRVDASKRIRAKIPALPGITPGIGDDGLEGIHDLSYSAPGKRRKRQDRAESSGMFGGLLGMASVQGMASYLMR